MANSVHLKPIHWLGLGLVAIFFAYLIFRVFIPKNVVPAEALGEEATLERINSVAHVGFVFSEQATVKSYANGEAIYQAVCIACHGAGLLQSPKLGDKAAWGPRLAQGAATLIKHATNGIRQMPARGGNATLSDYDVARAVVYMTRAAGANFAEPTAPKATANPSATPAAATN